MARPRTQSRGVHEQKSEHITVLIASKNVEKYCEKCSEWLMRLVFFGLVCAHLQIYVAFATENPWIATFR